MNPNSNWEDLSKHGAEIFIDPFEDILDRATQVVVVCPPRRCVDKLLPLHVLLWGRDRLPLGLCKDIIFVPPLRCFLPYQKRNTPQSHLVVGNPSRMSHMDRGEHVNLGSLEGAEIEALYISKKIGCKPLIGPLATKDNVLDTLRDCQILHIASHATEQTICLANGNNLEYSEFGGVKCANLQLIVMAACKSANLLLSPFLSPIFHLNPAAFVGSMWMVSDVACSILMSKFYDELQKSHHPVRALHLAQRYLCNLTDAETRSHYSDLSELLKERNASSEARAYVEKNRHYTLLDVNKKKQKQGTKT